MTHDPPGAERSVVLRRSSGEQPSGGAIVRSKLSIALAANDRSQLKALERVVVGCGQLARTYFAPDALVAGLLHARFDLVIFDSGSAAMIAAVGAAVRQGGHLGDVIAISTRPMHVRLPNWSELHRDDHGRLADMIASCAASAGAGLARAFGPYELVDRRTEVQLDGRSIKLSGKEFGLVACLFRKIGETVSREFLLEAVWGARGDLLTRTVDVHASRARTKLELRGRHGYVLSSVYGQGYRIDAVSSDQWER